MSNKLLEVKNLSKYYKIEAGFKNLVLEEIDLVVDKEEKGKIITLLAPAGSGKSTLLKILSGIEKPTEGEVLYFGKNSHSVRITYIPEQPSSFPWLNVKQNLLFVNETNSSKFTEGEINNTISLAGLSGYENHFPDEKSIGFRFRISLAGCLLVKPDIILIDDSFKLLDSETKEELYDLIRNICVKQNIIFFLATTNISDAIFLSNDIFLMKKNPGKIFKHINLERDLTSDLYNKRDKKYFELRDEIETLFCSEGLINDFSFSI